MNTKFNIGDVVYFISNFNSSIENRIEERALLDAIVGGNIIEVLIRKNEVRYDIQSYDLMGNPTTKMSVLENNLFSSKEECVKYYKKRRRVYLTNLIKVCSDELKQLEDR